MSLAAKGAFRSSVESTARSIGCGDSYKDPEPESEERRAANTASEMAALLISDQVIINVRSILYVTSTVDDECFQHDRRQSILHLGIT